MKKYITPFMKLLQSDDPKAPYTHSLTIFICVGEVDFIAEEDHPLAQLYGGHDHAVGRPAVLTVVVKGLEQQLWGGGTGEVQTYHL